MQKLVRTTHIFMWVVWCILCASFVTKHILIVSENISANDKGALFFNLLEDGCWIVLQPLSSVLWIVRHWRTTTTRRKVGSWIFFIIPAMLTFGLYSNLAGAAITSIVNPSEANLRQAAIFEMILEGFWIYFPVASILSWLFQKRRIASKEQVWNCRYLFTPAVASLTIVGMLHLFVFTEEGGSRAVLGFIEELLWVYIPLLGNICSSLDHRRATAEPKIPATGE